jgi:hypothetical protein
MRENDRKKETHERKVKGQLVLSGSTMVVTSAPIDSPPEMLAYDPSMSSSEIAKDLVARFSPQLKPVYIQTVTETIERSKGLGRGISLGAEFKNFGEFRFEMKPTKEVKKTETVIWRLTPGNKKS